MEPAVLSARPLGRVPEETANVYGAWPPLTAIVALYAEPVIPLGSVAGVVKVRFEAIVMLNPWLACWPVESVTWTPNEKPPAVVGVPLITPDDALRLTPGGKAPDETPQE